MTLTEYRSERGITQKELAKELAVFTGRPYDKAFISKVESGMAVLPENVMSYLNTKINFKAVATGSDARKEDRWTTMPTAQKKWLKSAIPENWHAKGLTQKERVLGYVKEQGGITSKEAYDYLGITQLGARIFELERQGWRFDRKKQTAPNRYGKLVAFTKYVLEAEDGTENMDRQ